MPADPQKVRDLFLHAVAKLPPEEWDGFAAEACAGDLAVEQQLRHLLHVHREAGSFLDVPAPAMEMTIDQPPVEQPGAQIGPYKLLEQIGEGGFGVVYLAEQTGTVRRKVALKILKPGMDSRQIVARFDSERQALALMDHPHIAKIFDGGSTPTGRPYFVMELVKGVPINDFCDQHQLTPRQRLELFIPVCQAVQHAHQKGIIHRDLKPSNVLVSLHDSTPVVKVIDFGVAKALGQELTDKTLFTGIAQMIGTPLYMSPEQAGMSDLDIDTRSDIYSLGVLLYELLTGSTPISKDRLKKAAYDEIRRIIREEEPPKPSTRLSESKDSLPSISAQRQTEPTRLTKLVSGEMDWIVMKALEKDRNRRYETVTGLATDIQRYLNDEPVAACPPSAAYRLRKLARRNKVAITTTGFVAAALILGLLATSWQAIRATNAERLAEKRLTAESTARRKAVQAQEREAESRKAARAAEAVALAARDHEAVLREHAESAESDARWSSYSAQMNLAQQAWENGRAGKMLELLEAQRSNSIGRDFRGFEWYFFWRLLHKGHRFTMRGHEGAILSMAFSPDGTVLASGSEDGTIRLWNPATGMQVAILRGHTGAVQSIAFSPDGRVLASGGADREVRLWDSQTRQVTRVLAGHSGIVSALVFAPGGETLASAAKLPRLPDGIGEIKLWTLSDGSLVHDIRADGAFHSIAFSPDGQTLASGGTGFRSTIKLWDCKTGSVRDSWAHGRFVYSLMFSPDGTTLVTGSQESSMKVWNITDGQAGSIQPSHTYDGYAGSVRAVVFSPNGKLIASASDDGTVKLHETESRRRLESFGHLGAVLSLAFSPNGTMLATAGVDGTIKTWNTNAKQENDTLTVGTGQERQVWSLAFSQDGATLASGHPPVITRNRTGEIKLWDVITRKERSTIPTQPFAVAFSPDGHSLASANSLWDVKSLTQRVTLGHDRYVWAVDFSGDGRTLASASWDRTAKLWDVGTGQQTASFSGVAGHAVAISPDGTVLATDSHERRVVILWDIATRVVRFELPVPSEIATLSFVPDGQTLIAVGFDGNVTLWNPENGNVKVSFATDSASTNMRGIAFLPRWNTLAVGGADGTLKLWDIQSGHHRIDLKGHSQEIYSAAATLGGELIVTGSSDGVIKWWQAATDQAVNAQSYRIDATAGMTPAPTAEINAE